MKMMVSSILPRSNSKQQLTLLLLLLSCGGSFASAAAATTSSSTNTNNDGADSDLPHLLRRGSSNNKLQSNNSVESSEAEALPWYHPTRMLVPNKFCPAPDTITTLSNVRTGQYGSSTGDCFYMYWDPSKCDLRSGKLCPLYVYVDGTEQGADIDERDTLYMAEMAARGYVAVTVDYADNTMGYINGCDGADGFRDKSQKIFDPQLTGSVLNQLCYDIGFEHRNHVPVDCAKGVAVGGWSQGAHIASLAGNYGRGLITSGLFWGNGNYNLACAAGYSTCSICPPTDVSCMNSENIALPKEKRRNINGDEDSFFGACEGWFGWYNRENVIDQLRSISGYSCPYSQDNCFEPNPNKAGYYAIPGKGHNFMDSNPNSDFMDPSTPWGLPMTFDWLAEQGRTGNDSTSSPTKQPSMAPTSDPTPSPTTAAPSSKAPTNDPTSSPTKQPSKAPTTSDPTSSPTTAAAPGICSSNSGTAGTPCHESSECQCGGRRLLQHDASENPNNDEANQQRDLAKGGNGGNGGNKPNPPSPTPPVTPAPVTPAPTSAPSPEVCGCIFPSTPAPAPSPESCSSFTSKNTCNGATGCFTSCFWCDDSGQPTNGKGQCCAGI